ncbi:MAG: 1-acylglycerol-3-phosphate O-acyltransferase [Aliidiomarina sp.]|uniref:1-acylglycerol-3-phosphate O-acyltransferase n=1 Tax=Aliidiomarina sp. TaxID=1872439 RepID=UPI0025BCC1FC|nr:1-acylglycerol-3-phosphate O-acyltransferase [Aliidiomarina sp.]MCH8502178.1 1-acylglycerol-3-phosphate O-acyltransferase [Aliidiomarina sp.]
MLAVIRLLILGVFVVLAGVLGSLFCLVRPFHRNNTALFAHLFGRMHKLLGVDLEIRVPEEVKQGGPFVYIANHQNSYDIFTMSRSLLPGTVTIGKKSLKWVPFFGQLYWLSGNILIDRKNSSRAHGTIGTAVNAIQQRNLSIWMFPEGTRSYGRGLLPFKTGAFHTAVQAKVPLVPVCMSTTHEKIKLNRWNNGKVIIEMMPPIDTLGYSRERIRELMATSYEQMLAKINRLDEEVKSVNSRIKSREGVRSS